MNKSENRIIVKNALAFCKDGVLPDGCTPIEVIEKVVSLGNETVISYCLMADRHIDGHHNINYENGTRDIIEKAFNSLGCNWDNDGFCECISAKIHSNDIEDITLKHKFANGIVSACSNTDYPTNEQAMNIINNAMHTLITNDVIQNTNGSIMRKSRIINKAVKLGVLNIDMAIIMLTKVADPTYMYRIDWFMKETDYTGIRKLFEVFNCQIQFKQKPENKKLFNSRTYILHNHPDIKITFGYEDPDNYRSFVIYRG